TVLMRSFPGCKSQRSMRTIFSAAAALAVRTGGQSALEMMSDSSQLRLCVRNTCQNFRRAHDETFPSCNPDYQLVRLPGRQKCFVLTVHCSPLTYQFR